MTDYPKSRCYLNRLPCFQFEFDNFYNKEITKRYHDYEVKRLSKRKDKKRDTDAAGRPFKLDVKGRFLMILVYYRHYITYTLDGFIFDLERATFDRDIQKNERLVRKCIPILQKINKITKRLRTLDEIEKYFPSGFLVFIDSTEQQIPRPKNKMKRKAYYPVKKKRHEVKTQVMVNHRRIIIYKTGYKKGNKHDYDIYKENHPTIPNELVNVFDLGYLGVEKDFPEQLSALPKRKKRNKELSQEEKKHNKSHSRKKIVIEHTICRLKKYRILADIFRNKLSRYNKVSDIVSGLVNYQVINQHR